MSSVRVLAFDTFGTVADWHTGVSSALAQVFPELEASQVARDWRRTYAPILAEVEAGRRPWTLLDDLHGETLDRLLREKYAVSPTPEQIDAAVRSWHRYEPAAEVYLGLAGLMQVEPHEVMMVATHATDLAAARSVGLQTAYVSRPDEWGPEAKLEEPDPDDAFAVRGIDELADRLGC